MFLAKMKKFIIKTGDKIMGRLYSIQLSCGCLVSLDGGGGLIPCSYERDNLDCKYFEEFLCSPEYVGRQVQTFINNNNVSSNDKKVVAVREQAQRVYEQNLLKREEKKQRGC
jgi:hypothetical protein